MEHKNRQKTRYYDGKKLLNMKDLNGNAPEIFICTSNRSAGKTTFFNHMVVENFLNNGEKFCLLYRYNYELSDVSDKFFKDIQHIYYNNKIMCEVPKAHRTFCELKIADKPEFEDETPSFETCGYAITINNADQLKKYSHLLSDISCIIFDEFQSETNNYCPNEITKFQSIHVSLARGGGKQVKYLPVYMISNPVTILNPYYVAMGISDRLRTNTKFLRGNGFVLESAYFDNVSNAQKQSGFAQAFVENNGYFGYGKQNAYLNDNYAFVEKPVGKSRYIATLRCDGKEFAIRMFSDSGIIYCDNSIDNSFKTRISITTEDHNVNYISLREYKLFFDNLRYYFDRGCFRFKNLECKSCIFKALSL